MLLPNLQIVRAALASKTPLAKIPFVEDARLSLLVLITADVEDGYTSSYFEGYDLSPEALAVLAEIGLPISVTSACPILSERTSADGTRRGSFRALTS